MYELIISVMKDLASYVSVKIVVAPEITTREDVLRVWVGHATVELAEAREWFRSLESELESELAQDLRGETVRFRREHGWSGLSFDNSLLDKVLAIIERFVSSIKYIELERSAYDAALEMNEALNSKHYTSYKRALF